jgi:hypothetical protein
MTQEIKPTYVTFEQAKWLKEKGFKGRSRYYGGSGELVEVPNIIENDYRHTNNEMQRFRWEAPEQHQVVEWLRVNHDIWISVYYKPKYKQYDYSVVNINWNEEELSKNLKKDIDEILENIFKEKKKYDSPQEAYSAAFDYIKNKNLI